MRFDLVFKEEIHLPRLGTVKINWIKAGSLVSEKGETFVELNQYPGSKFFLRPEGNVELLEGEIIAKMEDLASSC